MERAWKLGADVHENDNLMDGFTYEDIITALHCAEPVIDEAAVRRTVNEIYRQNITNMYELLEINIKEIIKLAKACR